jgi:universal stress protein A
MFKRILIAVDDTDSARRALRQGTKLASESSAVVKLVHVVYPPPDLVPDSITVEDYMLRKGEELIARLQLEIPDLIAIEEEVLRGRPADEILAEARRWDADLVVVGDHNRNIFSRFLLGSTADAVVRHAPCPVLVIRQKTKKPGTGHPVSAEENVVGAGL